MNAAPTSELPRCPGCGSAFAPDGGCSVDSVTLAGEQYSRLALGSETSEWWVGRQPDAACHDCSVSTGRTHHVGCDMEQCPRCGDQLLTCDCKQRL